MKKSPLKRKPFTKKSQETLRKKLHKKAWRLMSLYIRKRDNGICVTCGKLGNQAGHFIHGKLDFNFTNIHCQCMACNHFKSGNLARYATFLVKEYGYQVLEELEIESNIVHKYTVEELEAIINNLNYLMEGR